MELTRRGPRTARRATALVAVMIVLLVAGGLASLLLTRSGASRRRFQAVQHHLQRELALDAGLAHAFHLLEEVLVDSEHPLGPEPVPAGGGELAGIPYSYRLRTDPQGKSVRIDAETGGEGPKLAGHAVALVKVEEDPESRIVRQTWGLVYYGPEPQERESPGS